jgi:excisionase family DNA binding protein
MTTPVIDALRARDLLEFARVLCSRRMRTGTGLTFTKRRVQSIRVLRKIPAGSAQTTCTELTLTTEQVARALGVSSKTVHHWLQTGLLRGRQSMPSAPWRIILDDDTRRRLAGRDVPEGWVDLAEAVRCLGVSKQTVVSWVKSGRLQATRVARGGRSAWRIRVDSTGLEKQNKLF